MNMGGQPGLQNIAEVKPTTRGGLIEQLTSVRRDIGKIKAELKENPSDAILLGKMRALLGLERGFEDQLEMMGAKNGDWESIKEFSNQEFV
jgi:hypothetical protein